MAIIKPYLQDFVLGNRDCRALRWRRSVTWRSARSRCPTTSASSSSARPAVRWRSASAGIQENTRTIYTIGRQVIYTAVAIANGFAALWLHGRNEDALARWFGTGAGVAVFFLGLSSLFGRPRRS